MMCSGYYDYEKGYTPEFPGSDSFKGTIIHPQKWDETTIFNNKKVVVIGSGATAITLVPVIARKAKKVIMLQRSPTYILSLPGEDKLAKLYIKILPSNVAFQLSRWKNILVNIVFYKASKKWPNTIKRLIQKRIKKELGNDYDKKHFDPVYNPWDQRICVVPDADLFHSIKEGKVELVTDTINHFTPKGILLNSGEELEADIIVTATGLKLQLMGGMTLHINGELVDTSKAHCYRGVMFSDVPNMAVTIGYTNSSWTLKCDLNCQFATKVLNFMDRKNFEVCTPRFDKTSFDSEPFLDLKSGFILRAADILPKQGSRHPWKVYQNYIRDLLSLKLESVDDRYLEYR